MMLTFNTDDHAYHWQSSPVPSVTQLIGEFVPVSVYGVDYYVNPYTKQAITQETFREAADFGTAAHKATYLLLGDRLDMDSLHPLIFSVVTRVQEWIKQYSPDVLHVEQPMFSGRYRYAGTPDIICRLSRRLSIVDLKTGAHEMAGPQLAGYQQLATETLKYYHPVDRYVLHVPKNTDTWTFKKMQDVRDWPFFLSRITQFNFMRR